MKALLIIISSFLYSNFLFAECKMMPEIQTPLSKETWLFALGCGDNILYLRKANEGGIFFMLTDFTDIYLKDSFLSDDIFKKKCTGKILHSPSYSSGLPGTFDNYDPLRLKIHVKSNILLERLIFYFRKYSYTARRGINLKVFKNEVIGYRKPIWTENIWPFIVYEFSNKKRSLILTGEETQNFYSSDKTSRKCYDQNILSGKFLPLDRYSFAEIDKNRKNSNYESKPYFKKVDMFQRPARGNSFTIPPMNSEEEKLMEKLLTQSSLPQQDTYIKDKHESLPVMLIDPDHHTERADKEDWCIYTYMNSETGDFFQYFFFEKELEYAPPFFLRHWAIDYLAGVHICKKSTAAIILKPNEKVAIIDNKKIFNSSNVIMTLENKKQWRPSPVPENKNTIPLDRLYYIPQPGRLFGSYSKVWELVIWERLGMTFKLNPKAEIYLCGYGTLLQAAETQTVEEEHALIKKCGVRMTAERYAEFEKLK